MNTGVTGPVVVVGAGIGGLRTVQRLRTQGFAGDFVVVGAELHRPYNRPPLSKEALAGGDLPVLLTPQLEHDLDADWRLGVRATALDPVRRVVVTAGGEIAYDHVVVATGAYPRRLAGLPGVVLRTWDDAIALRGRFAPGRTVAVIGAGVLGCEIAASALGAGCDVHLLDVEPGPMTRVVGPVLAAEVAALHTDRGVRLHLGVTATAEDGRLRVSDGTTVDADVVVQAVGAVPDAGWLTGSGVDVDGGVVVDTRGQASVDRVHAVGDVALWAGHRYEHWTSATEQADAVAADIVGADAPPTPVRYWWSDQHGVKLQGLGDTGSDLDLWVGRFGPHERRVALYARDGILVGAVGFSAPPAVMPLRAAIADGVPVAQVVGRFGATLATNA